MARLRARKRGVLIMKCNVEGCPNIEDLNFGELLYHLRDVHAFGDRKMLEYFVENMQTLKEEWERYE